MRRRRNGLRVLMWGCVLAGMPLLAAGMLQLIPQIPVAANRLNDLRTDLEQEPADNREDPPCLSSGYGWLAEEPDAPKPEQTTETATQPEAEPVFYASGDPGEKPYPTVWHPGTARIVRMAYQRYSGGNIVDLDKCGQVRNCTSVDNAALLEESRKAPAFTIMGDGSPEVLIMHSHTTESFEPYVREYGDAEFNYRTTDPALSVVMVGDQIEAQLKKAGIGVIHDGTIHDYPRYTGSYDRSRVVVKRILEENPTIKVVLDIHRDAIVSNGNLLQPVIDVDGQDTAQVMIISGCDNGSLNMPNYMKNFRFASCLQQQIESDTPGLTRPVLFDYRKYNQDLTTGSLLIEVGSHGNTLAQVKRAGSVLGASIARALLNLKEET
ncbi:MULTISPECIES: stage II sporulation protein P [Ruminococcus]|uniref:stage II sporulation protein P n=1 Tax=Ruminococcus TaxID=1263 RepID=UPI000340048B|nr:MULTISPECIES: stage II sporulation protein P [Ruminococcus]MED9891950.1 stage II sporulation protein P [Ruminococcus champanellensis]CDD53252.1 stage II sporulation protein P [Ruminococcus sp. CAG:379]